MFTCAVRDTCTTSSRELPLDMTVTSRHARLSCYLRSGSRKAFATVLRRSDVAKKTDLPGCMWASRLEQALSSASTAPHSVRSLQKRREPTVGRGWLGLTAISQID